MKILKVWTIPPIDFCSKSALIHCNWERQSIWVPNYCWSSRWPFYSLGVALRTEHSPLCVCEEERSLCICDSVNFFSNSIFPNFEYFIAVSVENTTDCLDYMHYCMSRVFTTDIKKSSVFDKGFSFQESNVKGHFYQNEKGKTRL